MGWIVRGDLHGFQVLGEPGFLLTACATTATKGKRKTRKKRKRKPGGESRQGGKGKVAGHPDGEKLTF